MRAIPRIVLVTLILTTASHRLPAPISEKSPTPAPEQSAKPKPKHAAKPKPTAEKVSSSTAQPTPQQNGLYAGTWIGTIIWSASQITEHTVVIDAAQKTVNISGCASSIFPASVGADGISWVTGIFHEHKWTLKPNPDGKTALVMMNGSPAVFKRVK